MDLYFERHDGQAVTCDDFRAAMADANERDLTQFERWYSQAGTPVVKADTRYDADAKTYDITLTQSCPPTPGQPKKLPFHIPVAVGLLGADGKDMQLGQGGMNGTTAVLELTEATPDLQLHRRATKRRRRRSCAIFPRRWCSSTRTPTTNCCTCSATTAIRSTAGKPASAWRWRAWSS